LGESLEHQRILELGAANAYVGMYLASVGACYYGLDLSTALLARTYDWSPVQGKAFNLLTGNLFRLPFKCNSVDLVYSQGVLEHFTEDAIMAALRESLRVSPVVAFVVPTSNWRGGVRGDENLWPVDKWLELVNT